MTSTSISGKCVACRRWVTNGVICNNCDCCFHINYANSSPSLLENSMQWNCITCKYQKHAKHQEQRIRHLEQELRSAKTEIKFLKTGYTGSKLKFKISHLSHPSGVYLIIPSPGPVGSLLMIHLIFN